MKKILIVVLCLVSLNMRAMQIIDNSFCSIENRVDTLEKIIDYLKQDNNDAAYELQQFWNEKCPHDLIVIGSNSESDDWCIIL